MSVVVAYKYASNPQDASVAADGTVDWSRAKASVSEYDPVAVQVGRRVADAAGVELVGVSVGTSAVASPMAKKAAMSRGMDRGLVVADDAVATWNATQVAAALAELVRQVGDADLVLTGDASIDENAKIVSALLAAHLRWPCFQDCAGVEKAGDGWAVTQNIPGGTRVLQVAGPVVVATSSDAVQPKVPGMKDILAAGKKTVAQVAVADLGLADLAVDLAGRSRPEVRARKNKVFSGDDAAAQLVAAMKADGII